MFETYFVCEGIFKVTPPPPSRLCDVEMKENNRFISVEAITKY